MAYPSQEKFKYYFCKQTLILAIMFNCTSSTGISHQLMICTSVRFSVIPFFQLMKKLHKLVSTYLNFLHNNKWQGLLITHMPSPCVSLCLHLPGKLLGITARLTMCSRHYQCFMFSHQEKHASEISGASAKKKQKKLVYNTL